MADINSPKEFLTELSELVTELDKAKTELKDCAEEKANLDGRLEAIKASVEKEKAETVRERRADLESGFDKQIRAVDAELDDINADRKKALNEGMKKRAEEATKGVRSETDSFKNAFQSYVGAQKLPWILKRRFYYSLFCPGVIGYIFYVLLFAAILIFAGMMTKSRAAAGLSITPFFVLGVIDIILLFIYIMIWSNTRVRYRDEIKNCLNIINSIKRNEETARNIEENIKKTGDDNSYDLHEYDEKIASVNEKRAQLSAQKAEAVNQFESVTRAKLIEDIDLNRKAKLDETAAAIEESAKRLKAAADKATELETRLNQEFISYVGAKNITSDRIAGLKELIESGQASSVSEAVSKLD